SGIGQGEEPTVSLTGHGNQKWAATRPRGRRRRPDRSGKAMPTSPTVSVIIIFLDAERYLNEAIRSVFDQTVSNWELLLVDDGSSDASSTIARCHAAAMPERIRYLEHSGHENRGMSASRNLGIRTARGRYVAFLDADDVWLPDR